MPIGLVMGAFVFAWAALLFKGRQLALSARYCAIVALLFWFPAVLFGFMDWRHFFNGAWLSPITVKLVLAGILMILLVIGLVLGSRGREGSRGLLAIYSLCLLTVIGLGYFGAQLVYAGKAQATPEQYRAGERIFLANCSACHPQGGNVIKPQMPIHGSTRLKDLKTFIKWIRHPDPPMPVFDQSQISDQQADELYQYIVHLLETQKNPAQ
jgi:mono/diheme cytochrome c family protein